MTTTTIDTLTETIAIQWKTNDRRHVPGTTVAPGLAINQRIDDDGNETPGRYSLTLTQSGLSLVWNKCANHIKSALALVQESGIDWSQDADTLRADPAARTVFEKIYRQMPYCDTGNCPGGEFNVARWCAEQADAFRTFENREMAMYGDDADRDTALIEWVIRVLARPGNAGTAEVRRYLNKKAGAI